MYNILFIMLFISGLFYAWAGIYGIFINRERLNRIYAHFAFSLSIWALSHVMIYLSPNYQSAKICFITTMIGSCLSYSFVLYYALLLCQKGAFLKKKIGLLLLHFPLLLTIIYFLFFDKPPFAPLYALRYVNGHWIYQDGIVFGQITFWMLQMLLYPTLSVIFMLLYIFKHNAKALSAQILVKPLIIMLSCAIPPFMFSIFTDILLKPSLTKDLPPLAGLVCIAPLLGVMYCTKKYFLFKAPEEVTVFLQTTALKRSILKQLYAFHATVIFIFAGLLFMDYYFILKRPFSPQIHILFFLFSLIALFTYLIFEKSAFSAKTKENLLLFAIALTCVIMALSFPYENVFVLFFCPIQFLILGILFDKKSHMLKVIGIILANYFFLLWTRFEHIIDYNIYQGFKPLSFEIATVVLSIFLIYYVGNIFRNRIRELNHAGLSQTVVSKISTLFMENREKHFEETAKEALKALIEFLNLSHGALLFFHPETLSLSPLVQVSSKEGQSHLDLRALYLGNFHYTLSEFEKDNTIQYTEYHPLPLSAQEERDYVERHQLSYVFLKKFSILDQEAVLMLSDSKKGFLLDDSKIQVVSIFIHILAVAYEGMLDRKIIEKMAYQDSLTGLPNTLYFKSQLESLIAHGHEKFAVLFLDLDSFKHVNDTIGHDGGDGLIKIIASDILAHLDPAKHEICRFGGDEFLILIRDFAHLAEISDFCKELLLEIKKPYVLSETEFFVSATIGVALYPDHGQDGVSLIKNADMAMYETKAKNKGTCGIYRETLANQNAFSIKLQNDLHHAIKNHEFELYYQPQVDGRTGEIIGAEALLRWNNPTYGRVSPSVFIPLAEQSGAIHELGLWVIKTAARQNKMWQQKGLPFIPISVNVSIHQFKKSSFIENLKKALGTCQLSPQYLEIEITENYSDIREKELTEILDGLHAYGFVISIDDFGTKYSSMLRLKNFPIDKLKIDMDFIRGIGYNKKDEGIIRVISYFASTLGMRVIAEGVENKAQKDFLLASDCFEIQGYYYAKPLPAPDFEQLLSQKIIVPAPEATDIS